MSTTTFGVQGITEDDIANYLANTPGFFERNAELLAAIQLTSPHGQRAVSLQERQMEMLRERNKGLERKLMEMIRHGQENAAIDEKLHRWTRGLMLTTDPKALPSVLAEELAEQFLIPQTAIRVWGVAEEFRNEPFATDVSEEAKAFAAALTQPYCGLNTGFEAARWLEDPSVVVSLALVPMRHGLTGPTFGLLVLASPDATRYTADMGTDFLIRLGELASASLTRLLPPAPPAGLQPAPTAL